MSKVKCFFIAKLMSSSAGKKLVGLLFSVLPFLIPVLGWNPLLLLWLAKIACAYKETTSRGIHLFYCFMALICITMIIMNLYMRFAF